MKFLLKIAGLIGAGGAMWAGSSFSDGALSGTFDEAMDSLGLGEFKDTIVGRAFQDNWPLMGSTLAAATGLAATGQPKLAFLALLGGIGWVAYNYISARKSFNRNAAPPSTLPLNRQLELAAGAGNDTVGGGAGNDQLQGGTAADQLIAIAANPGGANIAATGDDPRIPIAVNGGKVNVVQFARDIAADPHAFDLDAKQAALEHRVAKVEGAADSQLVGQAGNDSFVGIDPNNIVTRPEGREDELELVKE